MKRKIAAKHIVELSRPLTGGRGLKRSDTAIPRTSPRRPLTGGRGLKRLTRGVMREVLKVAPSRGGAD